MKVLALDYDGVIADSKIETFIIAYNTYLKLYRNKEYENKKIDVKDFDIGEWNDKINKFTKLRAFVTHAGQFRVGVSELIDKEINNQGDFEKAIQNSAVDGDYFKEQFHLYRRAVLKSNFGDWLKLTPPFGRVLDAIKLLIKDNKVVIVTGNDAEVVQKYLLYYGVRLIKEHIYDSYVSKSKKEKMGMIKERFGVEFEDMISVDDTLRQLAGIRSLGVNCFMATWGYNNEGQRKKAQEEGITLLTQENFYDKISMALK